MKVCFSCVEIFAWGKAGGFGRATRTIGRELVKRGIEVFAVVPRRGDQRPVEDLDGITVLSFPMYAPWTSWELYKKVDADVYHSSEPSLATYIAMNAMPHRKHIITVRDPRNLHDWKEEFNRPSLNRLQVLSNFFYEHNSLASRAVRRAEMVYSNAKYLVPKIKSMYSLKSDPIFLPTPVDIPGDIHKASTPTVCYLARLDRRKRPEIFLELAKNFPHVKFIAMGKSRDKRWESRLEKTYSNSPNLQMTGFVDQFTSDLHSQILEQSWVMVNTATREALPNAFLEAAAHKCAILSFVDPDGFASQYGYHAKDDDFSKGLEFLLQDHRWKQQGEAGYEYVKNTFQTDLAIDQHLQAYESLLAGDRVPQYSA